MPHIKRADVIPIYSICLQKYVSEYHELHYATKVNE